MTVRKTSAFAAERKKPKHGTLDFYPTPAWATEALFENILTNWECFIGGNFVCWEPACGKGHMSDVLNGYFTSVVSTDVKDYGYAEMDCVFNFITGDLNNLNILDVDWIITNPPFNLADKFILRALNIAEFGVAIFARIQLLEGAFRYHNLYSKEPPTIIAPFASRVNLKEGGLSDKSGQMMFAWYVWERNRFSSRLNKKPPKVIWIPPRGRGNPRQKKMFDKKDAEK